MKLLFDRNLSPKSLAQLADVFPGSAHVDRIGSGSELDNDIWSYAQKNDYMWSARTLTFTRKVFCWDTCLKSSGNHAIQLKQQYNQ